jgi:hypothetical protein
MDERLLSVADELAAVPWIPTAENLPENTGGKASPIPENYTANAPLAPDMHRKAAIMTLELSSGDNASQEEIVELVVRGPRSQVLQIQIQRIGRVH